MEKTSNTSNMYLAAALVSYGAEIDSVNNDNPRRLMWKFKSLPKSVFILVDSCKMERREIETVEDVKAIMASNKLLFMPNFVDSINKVKSYLYPE